MSLRTCSYLLVVAASIAFVAPGAVRAERPSLREALGGVQWGWTPKRVFQHFKQQIEANYEKPLAKATDAIEEDQLRHRMLEEIQQIKDSYFAFDGHLTAHDHGFLRDEFSHGNGEAMLLVRSDNADEYFFFINDRLWKRYRAFKASVFEGASFDDFGDALQARYGKAKRTESKPDEDGQRTVWYVWKQKGISARAIDNTQFYGFYSLVLEDPRTVSKLSKLRKAKPEAAPDPTEQIVDMVAKDDGYDLNADVADRISGEIRRQSPSNNKKAK